MSQINYKILPEKVVFIASSSYLLKPAFPPFQDPTHLQSIHKYGPHT